MSKSLWNLIMILFIDFSTTLFVEQSCLLIHISFLPCRYKLLFVQTRSEGVLPPHKMRWEQEWATSMRQSGKEFRNSCAVLTLLWKTLALMNVFPIMLLSFSSLHGWVEIVMVFFSISLMMIIDVLIKQWLYMLARS